MKYEPSTRTLQFTGDQEVARFHAEVTTLLRDAVSEASRHGDAHAGKLAAQAVFKDFASVMRALNALRRHLERAAGDYDPPAPVEEPAGGPASDPLIDATPPDPGAGNRSGGGSPGGGSSAHPPRV